jgi:hypothetical protein
MAVDMADDAVLMADEAVLMAEEPFDSAFSLVSVEQDDKARAVAAARPAASRAER